MYDPSNGHMCFAEALAYIKAGRPVARASWKQAAFLWITCGELVLVIPRPDTHAILFWTPSSQDVLAEDWVFVINADTQELESIK